MSDFQKSVGGREGPHEGWMGVNPIEKDKKSKEEYVKEKKEIPKSLLFASLMIFMKKFISLFSPKVKSRTLLIDKQQIVEDLLSFRKMLQILGHEDQSHNPEFTQQLSELWHNLLNASQQKHEKKLPYSKLQTFIDRIYAYPPSEDHSLGYYLTEYAGKEWLPFPFMDILHQLHQQYQENSQVNELNLWISQLKEIASSFNEKIDLNT
jgi:hypothetical protein